MTNQMQEFILASVANSNRGTKSLSSASSSSGDSNLWSEGPLSSFLITGEDTQGQAALIEAIHRQGHEPPAHIHLDVDETFYLIEGKMTFYVDGEPISASVGTTVFIGRGKEHSFEVETETANTLILVMPAETGQGQASA